MLCHESFSNSKISLARTAPRDGDCPGSSVWPGPMMDPIMFVVQSLHTNTGQHGASTYVFPRLPSPCLVLLRQTRHIAAHRENNPACHEVTLTYQDNDVTPQLNPALQLTRT